MHESAALARQAFRWVKRDSEQHRAGCVENPGRLAELRQVLEYRKGGLAARMQHRQEERIGDKH